MHWVFILPSSCLSGPEPPPPTTTTVPAAVQGARGPGIAPREGPFRSSTTYPSALVVGAAKLACLIFFYLGLSGRPGGAGRRRAEVRRTGVPMLGSQRGPMGGPSPPLGGVQISIFIAPAPLPPQILMCHMRTGGLEAEFFFGHVPPSAAFVVLTGLDKGQKAPWAVFCPSVPGLFGPYSKHPAIWAS